MDESSAEYWKQRLVGKRFAEDDEILPADISQDQIVRRRDLPKTHRVIKPNEMITADYRSDRLNIRLDENNRIIRTDFG
jgi:hypothetical protein